MQQRVAVSRSQSMPAGLESAQVRRRSLHQQHPHPRHERSSQVAAEPPGPMRCAQRQ